MLRSGLARNKTIFGENKVASDVSNPEDPCGDFGPDQKWAVVWLVLVLILGSFGVYQASNLDEWMYQNNAQVLDYEKYDENRSSASNLPMGDLDPRAKGGLNVARSRIAAGQ